MSTCLLEAIQRGQDPPKPLPPELWVTFVFSTSQNNPIVPNSPGKVGLLPAPSPLAAAIQGNFPLTVK